MALLVDLESQLAGSIYTNNLCHGWDRWVSFLFWICHWLSISAMKTMQTLSILLNFTDDIKKSAHFAEDINWSLIYILMTLATTIICTILIIYRIVRLAHRIFLFRSIISTMVESSAMSSLVLIVYLALVVMNLELAYYADICAAYVRVKRSLNSPLFNGWLFPHIITGHRSDASGATCGSQVELQS